MAHLLLDLFGIPILDLFGIPIPPLPHDIPPPPRTAPAMSREEAICFLSEHGKYPPAQISRSPACQAAAYRKAARKLHPDTGGSHELFVKLQQAKAALD
jgi:hypothetical protein